MKALISMGYILYLVAGLYFGFEWNFCFFAYALFRVLVDNLGLKRPANSCKGVAFAAGVQKEPKCCS